MQICDRSETQSKIPTGSARTTSEPLVPYLIHAIHVPIQRRTPIDSGGSLWYLHTAGYTVPTTYPDEIQQSVR